MICSIEGCEKRVKNRGWCSMHYERFRKHGDPLVTLTPQRGHGRPVCSIEGCGKPSVGRGWCVMHWTRWSKHGDPLVTLRPNRGSGCITANGYRVIWKPSHPLAMSDGYVYEHRMVAWDAGLLTDPALHVHHLNENKRDNRLENLEVVTADEHARRHTAERGYVDNQFGRFALR